MMNNLDNQLYKPDFLPSIIGCFASPVKENPTVAIMEAAFSHHGLHYRYINSEVGQDGLENAVKGAVSMGFRGFNCSLPNKIKVMEYLDEIGESARLIGAVNTVVIEKDGHTRGENTDGKGFVKAISEVTQIEGSKVLVLGAGGASRAISVEMALAGASEILIVNRHVETAEKLAWHISSNTKAKARAAAWDHEIQVPSDTDIVINATSVGLFPNVDETLNLDPSSLLPRMVVADCIPNPAETNLVKDARLRGCKGVLTGMNMLVNQAVISIKYWTGVDVDADVMIKEYQRVLQL